MCSKNACSVTSGRSLMVERAVWLVTPCGRSISHSGCTVVLVDGTTRPMRLRNPNVSGTAVLPTRCGTIIRGQTCLQSGHGLYLGADCQVFHRWGLMLVERTQGEETMCRGYCGR